MKVYDSIEYQRAKKRSEELKNLLYQLDTIGDLLYNVIEHDGIWSIVDKFEDVRMKYYMEDYENDIIINNKGNVNGKS